MVHVIFGQLFNAYSTATLDFTYLTSFWSYNLKLIFWQHFEFSVTRLFLEISKYDKGTFYRHLYDKYNILIQV